MNKINIYTFLWHKTLLSNIYITKQIMLDRGAFLLERTLTGEEKIRRAEEIYKRRKGRYSYGRDNRALKVSVKEEKNFSLFKKMILQIAICFVIYFIYYLIQNSNYIFSEEVLAKTKEILSYDIDIASLYEYTTNFLSEKMSLIENDTTPTNEITEQNTVDGENKEDNEENKNEGENNEENNGVGGAEIDNALTEDTSLASSKEETKPQTNEEYIKTNFSFEKPVEGVVSSEFGQRNSDNPIVSKNHLGIDIAAKTGTVIRAAMDGKVTVSSKIGDYGQHIKIVNNDVTTLYAHCSKLYVKEGDVVTKGQEIAEVGETGKATGPHLHFEIIRGITYINPRNILQF